MPVFSGKKKDYDLWFGKFVAFCHVKNCGSSLMENGDPNLPTDPENLSSDTDKKKLEEKEIAKNTLAMSYLTMALTNATCQVMIHKSKIDNAKYRDIGLAWVVMQKLRKKYKPTDKITEVELANRLNEVKMADDDEPEVLFNALAEINIAFDFKLTEERQMCEVMAKAPKAYTQTLATEETMFEKLGKTMTLDDMQIAMEKFYRVLNAGQSEDYDIESDELMAMNIDKAKAFREALCFNCGKKGHKANVCPNKNSNAGGGKFKGKCNVCGKIGHKKAQCFYNPQNKSKRPAWFKPKENKDGFCKEINAAAIEEDDERIELLMTVQDVENNNEIIEKEEAIFTGQEMCIPAVQSIFQDPNIFIGDTGASTHSTMYEEGIVGNQSDLDVAMMGNGEQVQAEKVGNISGTICDKNGTEIRNGVMQDVSYRPGMKCNVFSITKMQMNGWKLGGDENAIWLTKGTEKLMFDIKIKTKKGVIFCLYFKRKSRIDEVSAVSISGIKAHEILGHHGKTRTRAIANRLGWKITGSKEYICYNCTTSKAKQKSVPKKSTHQVSDKSNERIFLDISTVKGPKKGKVYVSQPQWCLKVDEKTQTGFSEFHEKKNEFIVPACVQFTKWKNADILVRYIRCDNAGENKKLEKVVNGPAYNLSVEFEYTARNTPQQNHLVELKFAAIAGRARAMMNRAHIPKIERYLLFKHAAITATKLDWLSVIDIKGVVKMRCEHWCGDIPKFARYLRMWGEAGTVTIKSKMNPKPQNRGINCMFVGYSSGHDGDCYDMWDPNTRRIHQSRDVTWLKRMFYLKPAGDLRETWELPEIPEIEQYLVEGEEMDQITHENAYETTNHGSSMTTKNQEKQDTVDEIDIGEEIVESDAESNEENESNLVESENSAEIGIASGNKPEKENPTIFPQPVLRKSKRIPKKNVRFIETMNTMHDGFTDSYQNDYFNLINKIAKDDFEEGEICCVGAGLGGGFENTKELKVKTYDESMNSKDKKEWEASVEKEHDRFVTNKCREVVEAKDLPDDAVVIDSTWAMKKKANGDYRSRCVMKGFMQKSGVHFDPQNISAPVSNDASIRIVFVLMLMAGWMNYLADVKGAFLMGLFENGEKIYTPVPQGFEKHYPEGAYWLLLKTVYGLKQAAKMFWKMLLKAMRSMNFEKSWADPCLYHKWTDDGLVLWLSWIDDCLCVGSKENVVKSRDEMLRRFDCDDVGEVKEYLGCKVDIDGKNRALRLTQPVILQSFLDEFQFPDSGRVQNIPAVAGSVLTPEVTEDEVLNTEEHAEYRTAVGKLLHVCRWSRPEIWNIVRELTRAVQKPGRKHMDSAKKVMKYCVGTPKRGWYLKPERKWDGNKEFRFRISGRSDSDFAKCPVTRKSVSGWNVKLEKCPVIVKSGMQRSPTLSVTESELVAGVTCAQDMLYVKNVLESIGLQVELPMKLEIDNKGAVDLTHNFSVNGRTKHIEYRYLWLRDMQEQNIIDVQWVHGEENETDIQTKNVSGPLFKKHCEVYCGIDEY